MMGAQNTSAVVLGGGAWGTALASMCARAGMTTTLWCRSEQQAADIDTSRENQKYLSGYALPDALGVSSDVSVASEAGLLILAVPAQATRETVRNVCTSAQEGTPIIITAKGLERDSNNFLTDIVTEEAPHLVLLVLSGPSFAADVMQNLPTAVTLAGQDGTHASDIARIISTPLFRVYASDDPVGVQIGGAVKNVLAIASGICAGKKFGASAQAALLARSFAELRRLAAFMGAKPETLFGLSGLGDLSLTCSSMQSRNFSLGFELGQGKPLQDILAGRDAVSEGVYTAGVVRQLAAQHSIEMPVSAAVADIVIDGVLVDDAVERLMSRPLKSEME